MAPHTSGWVKAGDSSHLPSPFCFPLTTRLLLILPSLLLLALFLLLPLLLLLLLFLLLLLLLLVLLVLSSCKVGSEPGLARDLDLLRILFQA